MKILVVFDSVFGNTEKIARAIGDALGSRPDVEILRVKEVRPEHLAGLKLLVVGSPTRAFRSLPAVKSFLRSITKQGLHGVKVAAFDTRMAMDDSVPAVLRTMAKLFGFAAEPILEGLRKKGGEPAVPPEGFVVKGSEGPLKDGELERAAAWGKGLAMSAER